VAAPASEPAAEAAVAATATPRYAALAVSPASAAPASAANPALVARTSAALPAVEARTNAAMPAATPRTSFAKAPAAAEAVREAAAPQRENAPLAESAGSRGIEKTWRDAFAAAPSSPAHAIPEAKESLDLSLEGGGRKSPPLDAALPAVAVVTPPQRQSLAWDPRPADSEHGGPETPLHLFDLPLPAPAVFARSSDDDAEEASPTIGSGSRHFLPVLAVLAIPEPGSAVLLGAALATLAVARRREWRA
jgi:hypothetical protein